MAKRSRQRVASVARINELRYPADVLVVAGQVGADTGNRGRRQAAIGQVINIGNTQEVTITQLAERVRELCASASTIKYIPYEEAYESGFEDMPRRVPDLSKVNRMIGYEPKQNLDDILVQVIDYFRGK